MTVEESIVDESNLIEIDKPKKSNENNNKKSNDNPRKSKVINNN